MSRFILPLVGLTFTAPAVIFVTPALFWMAGATMSNADRVDSVWVGLALALVIGGVSLLIADDNASDQRGSDDNIDPV